MAVPDETHWAAVFDSLHRDDANHRFAAAGGVVAHPHRDFSNAVLKDIDHAIIGLIHSFDALGTPNAEVTRRVQDPVARGRTGQPRNKARNTVKIELLDAGSVRKPADEHCSKHRNVLLRARLEHPHR